MRLIQGVKQVKQQQQQQQQMPAENSCSRRLALQASEHSHPIPLNLNTSDFSHVSKRPFPRLCRLIPPSPMSGPCAPCHIICFELKRCVRKTWSGQDQDTSDHCALKVPAGPEEFGRAPSSQPEHPYSYSMAQFILEMPIFALSLLMAVDAIFALYICSTAT
eukprot:scaffold4760_cov16-Tisochrysis_lutea.AAC.3